ncbi:hypothetical protein E4T50_04968 [Aureobasidium sp. EXF-12298]|nr:hypothetical protein E4T50_04968 [Aureobasidium sp. EXF-12298]KAI4762261.1 hypothetical protein E4T51_04746 [Aureobasidium sp. EXF-12344]
MASTADVPLLITSDNARSERRISPAWTIAQLKSRLEPITGIPASSQRLTLKVASWPDQNLQTVNEDNTQLGAFTLQSYAELHHPLNPQELVRPRTTLNWFDEICPPPPLPALASTWS